MKPQLIFRCSSLGRLMTEPKSKSEGTLSVGAKTLVREMLIQDIFSIDFEVSTKEMQKGIECEQESIDLLNRVRGLKLVKNTERRTDGFITGECDLFDPVGRRGYDLKTSWSVKTFPAWIIDAEDKAYEWQFRGYLKLWDAAEWSADYALIDTPEHLIGYEPRSMHAVGHIAEHLRLTSWVIKRDLSKEALIRERVEAAREYAAQLVKEFDATHVALAANDQQAKAVA